MKARPAFGAGGWRRWKVDVSARWSSNGPNFGMFGVVRKLASLLTAEEKRSVVLLLPLVAGMALLQVVGIASVLPFLHLVSDPSVLHRNEWMAYAYAVGGFTSELQFVTAVGVVAIAAIVASNAFAAFVTWRIDVFTFMQAHRMSCRLLESYLAKPYVFFLGRNSADLTKRVLTEVQQTVSGVLMPMLQIASQGAVALFILGFLVAFDPMMALMALSLLGGLYLSVFLGVRKKLARLGRETVRMRRYCYQYVYEALHGIKDARILGKEAAFVRQFDTPSRSASYNKAVAHIIGVLPRYALELVAFGSILLFVSYLLYVRGDVSEILPVLGVYAFASYRLMPSLQKTFSASAQIRFHTAALDNVLEDSPPPGSAARPSVGSAIARSDAPESGASPLEFRNAIEFRGVTFRYPEAERPVVTNLNLVIPVGSSVAFVGATGSGKSTTVDILLGLLEPQEGYLAIDGTRITRANVAAWQRHIGYVPQHIHLSQASVARNIAFGVPEDQIDMRAVERAARVARIHEFVAGQLGGYDRDIGDRGSKLSGGQRQRIGIARALYNDPAVIVLDEATSALDGGTEAEVLEAMEASRAGRTVIMIAHRLSTVRDCDVVYRMRGGVIEAQGTYEELMRGDAEFRSMAVPSFVPGS